ncbi:hypothetical protein BDZ89DRAFT_1179463, partial [Hymenopellis radicata]
ILWGFYQCLAVKLSRRVTRIGEQRPPASSGIVAHCRLSTDTWIIYSCLSTTKLPPPPPSCHLLSTVNSPYPLTDYRDIFTMSIIHNDLVHFASDNDAGQTTTLDAVTPSDAERLPHPPKCRVSLPFNQSLYHAGTNAASTAAPIVFVAPITQDEVAGFPAALWGLPHKTSQRKATGNDMTRRDNGKKKAAQQVQPNTTGYASSSAFQPPQAPSSVDLPSYKYPLPPCLSELAPYQALYEFPHPYTPDVMVPVLMQWIDIHRTPNFPEELDLVFVVCWKVPEERVPDVLEFMQRPLVESLWY